MILENDSKNLFELEEMWFEDIPYLQFIHDIGVNC